MRKDLRKLESELSQNKAHLAKLSRRVNELQSDTERMRKNLKTPRSGRKSKEGG